MGATIGPLITGFVLFEYYSIQTAVLLIGSAIAAIMLLSVEELHLNRYVKSRYLGTISLMLALGVLLHFTAYKFFLEKLQFASPIRVPYKYVDTNRNGIISVQNNDIFGNGIYDGQFNIYPDNRRNTNGIDRAYAVAAFHPNPKRILQIGVSSGSWTKVFSMYQPLEQLVAVEINKGYFNIIKKYPDHADILSNSKVNMVVEDGRHWLKTHPNEKFDIIAMNTIYFWRSNATNLLSREFMELCKQHLTNGGYLYLNTTEAEEVVFTAAQVFSYVNRAHFNMIIAGENPPKIDKEAKIANLSQFVYPDTDIKVFPDEASMTAHLQATYPNNAKDIRAEKGQQIITDDNMASEFKHHYPHRPK